MTELPPPARPGDESSPYPAARKSYYDADQMRAYAEEAIKQEREACAELVGGPAGNFRLANAIRARSSAPDTLEK